jgi:hypothetical protein
MELLVTGAQQLIELGGHPLPGRERFEVILQLFGDVLRHSLRHRREEDVAHVVVAVQLVHSTQVHLLRLSQRIPCFRAHLTSLLVADHLRQDLLGELRGVARVALDRTAAGKAAHREQLGARPRPLVARVEAEAHSFPALKLVTKPREALRLDRVGDGLCGAARRAVRTAEHDELEVGTWRRLYENVRGDGGVAILGCFVRAEHFDGMSARDLACGAHLAGRAELEAAVDEQGLRRRHWRQPRRSCLHHRDNVGADGGLRRAVAVHGVDQAPVVGAEHAAAAAPGGSLRPPRGHRLDLDEGGRLVLGVLLLEELIELLSRRLELMLCITRTLEPCLAEPRRHRVRARFGARRGKPLGELGANLVTHGGLMLRDFALCIGPPLLDQCCALHALIAPRLRHRLALVLHSIGSLAPRVLQALRGRLLLAELGLERLDTQAQPLHHHM